MRLVVSPRAADDIEDLRNWVLSASPRASFDLTAAIDRSFALLLELPQSAPVVGRRKRQRVVTFGRDGLIVHYTVRRDSILILRVLHGRQER